MVIGLNMGFETVTNGTLELDTQTFRPHRSEDMITKISKVNYEPTAMAPMWDTFISRIFQDENGIAREQVIKYIQKCAGYSMTSDVSAQAFFVLYGRGKNGKTKFTNAIKWVMGDYVIKGMVSILMASDKSSGKNTDDEADLFGARMVYVSEPQDGCRLNEAKVKSLVDTDTIRAMRKFEHSFEFQPTHKIWLQTNYKPKVQGDDDGIWRRIKLIPFLVQIPIEERDEHLDDKLQSEGSGILNWMLAGLREWYAAGRKLDEPREIRDAVGGYRIDSDSFGSFLSDCIEANDVDKRLFQNLIPPACNRLKQMTDAARS